MTAEQKRKLFYCLFPFTWGAVAINLFMVGLMAHSVGVSALSPVTSIFAALPLALPANWAAMRWVEHLVKKADCG